MEILIAIAVVLAYALVNWAWKRMNEARTHAKMNARLDRIESNLKSWRSKQQG